MSLSSRATSSMSVSSTRTIDYLVILITGASGGIGAATALRLAQPNIAASYKVEAIILHYNTNNRAAQAVQEKIASLNPSISTACIAADLADPKAVESMYEEAIELFGPINVLFANAGVISEASGPTGQMEDVSLETFERTWRVNTLSVYQLTKLCMPSMVQQQFGRIIYTSSADALTGGFVGPHYASSKSALHGMMHFLAGKYAQDGVTVNAVAPALIKDTMMFPFMARGEDLRNKIPVGRLGKPEEVANVVEVLIGNGYVTNKVWTVDGGLHPM